MILTSAQTKPHRFDTGKNLSDHFRMIELAARYKTDLIVFPELSLTGYERENARELAFQQNDDRLDSLKELAAKYRMIIIAGAPIVMEEKMFIGSFVLFPDGMVSIYTKQFLHQGEEEYYSSSFSYNPLIRKNGELISLAVCADIDNPQHPENASKLNTSVYIPSIFFSPGGIPEAYKNLGSYAKKYSMSVLMANFCGEAWGRPSGGQSACWNNKGELSGNLNDSQPGLLVVEKSGGQFLVHTVYC